MDDNAASIDYVRLLRRVASRHWKIVAAALLLVAVPIAAWLLLFSENLYEASATLFLLPERSDPAFLKDLLSPETNPLYVAILRSRSLAKAVTEALPRESREELTKRVVFRDYLLTAMNYLRRLRGEEVIVQSPSELAVRELQDARMSFDVAKDGTVTITAAAFSPRVAVDLANTYVDVLLAQSSSVARQQTRGTRELLEAMLAQARSAQTEAEDALRRFQTQAGGSVKLPDEARSDLTRLAQLETAYTDTQVAREIAQQRLAYLKGDQKASATATAVDAAAQPMRERVAELEAKVTALTEKYTDQHPLVQTTRAELKDAQERLRDLLQGHQTPHPAGVDSLKPLERAQLSKQMAELEVELLSARAKEQSLQYRIGRVKQSLASMSVREQQYSTLARAAETQRNLSAMLTEKLTAARISEQSQLRGVHVVDLATLPRQPSSKRPLKFILLGLFASVGLGFGLGLVLEYRQQVIETEEEVAATTGFPVLGSIPFARRPGAPALPPGPLNFMVRDATFALPADACRSIRTTLQLGSLDRPICTLLVTSPGVHEGKSTALVNLARAFLETSRRVLLIDADLRRPALHRAFGVPNERGLADMLNGGSEPFAGLVEVMPDLKFLPAGAHSSNPSALLSSAHLRRVLTMARKHADVVLIDSPPVLAVSDCLPLAALVDGVLLVTWSGVTQRRSLVRAKVQLEKANARVVGAVVNGLSPRDARRYYRAYHAYMDGQHGTPKKKRWHL